VLDFFFFDTGYQAQGLIFSRQTLNLGTTPLTQGYFGFYQMHYIYLDDHCDFLLFGLEISLRRMDIIFSSTLVGLRVSGLVVYSVPFTGYFFILMNNLMPNCLIHDQMCLSWKHLFWQTE
jgi:hypothetical protein